MDLDLVTEKIIGAAIEVHRVLGPGLMESPYESCFALELTATGLPFLRQHPIPLFYKGLRADCACRVDFLVADAVVVEIKAVAALDPIFTAQAITYLRLTGCPIALLINFNVQVLRKGIKRIVLGYQGGGPGTGRAGDGRIARGN